MLYIITGGSGSGKSEYAEQTAVQCRNRTGGTLWYLATMRIWDDEGRKRVERHRRMRAAKGFETIERYTGLETLELEERFEESNSAGLDDEQENDSLKRWESCRVAQKPVLLLECMSNLVLNEFYDQEIIQMIAGTTGMTSEFIRQKEESMTNSLLYDFVNQMYLYGKEEEEAPKDKIFEAESKVIRELAAKGKCVIIGRCSDYVLCENEKTLKLFFAAPLEVRAKRIMERLNISKKEAEQVIRKEDRRRADNYRYYTGRVWGSAANVDLTFNTAMDERYIEECISKAMELEI